MGDEALIDLLSFDLGLPGKRFAKLRPLRNKATVSGVTIREITYAEVPFEQVDAVSREWLSRKVNQRELNMLVRPLPSSDEPDVRKFAAFVRETLVGIVVFNPLYEGGAVIGYVADIERYAPCPRGFHDLLLLEGIRPDRTDAARGPAGHLRRDLRPHARGVRPARGGVGRGRRYPSPRRGAPADATAPWPGRR